MKYKMKKMMQQIVIKLVIFIEFIVKKLIRWFGDFDRYIHYSLNCTKGLHSFYISSKS